MHISDLIAALQEALAEHGDLPVYVNDTKEDVVELKPDWINVENDDEGSGQRLYIG